MVRNDTRRPLGLLVSNADIFQSSGCEHGPLLESNELTYAGDDCVNIHNYFSVVLKRDAADPKRVLLLDGVGAHDIVGDGHYADAYEDWHQQLNTFSQVKIGDVARVCLLRTTLASQIYFLRTFLLRISLTEVLTDSESFTI